MSLPSYAVFNDMPPFDWLAFLERAIAKTASDEEIRNAVALGRSWVTCACGNQCASLPRDSIGAPIDEALHRDGANFTYEVFNHQWPKAVETLKRIERRSAQLLNA